MALEDSLDLLNSSRAAGSGYLTCDSRANSDYEDTDGETDACTDGEAEDAYNQEGLSRSSEPAQASPSHSLRDQVSAHTLLQGAAGTTRAHSYPVAQAQCHIELLQAPAAHSCPALVLHGGNIAQTQARAQILPLPLTPTSLWSFTGN